VSHLEYDASRALLERLPLVTLYLSERCNSRCVSCDYWRHGRADMDLAAVEALLPALEQLRTEAVLLSGGEPLLNPQWPQIAQRLRAAGLDLWLLTSGLSLAKHAREVAVLFHHVTVSLDGTDAATYAAIRGLDAFDKVCEGITAAARAGVATSVRVTLQRANFRQLPGFVVLARQLGAQQVSFLAVDVANPHAFARETEQPLDLALGAAEAGEFTQLLEVFEREHADDFDSHFIAESRARLRHIGRYFAAVAGSGVYPAVRCNAPEFSAVIDARGHVSPCFFIRGPAGASLQGADLTEVLNSAAAQQLRTQIRAGERHECRSCVCSLWRDPGEHAIRRPALAAAAAHV
jgi:Fe-coproporphyrin III synthase